jgi:hypothetical protein
VLAQASVESTGVDEETVRRILAAEPDFKWLDESSGWFWFGTGCLDNALTSRIRKALAVSGRVGVSEVRSAISKDPRLQGFSPPRRVIIEACRQADGIGVEGESTIVAKSAIQRDKALSAGERVVADILGRHGGLMNGPDLEKLCMEAGMSKPNFWKIASGSPIIFRYAPMVYGLTGTDVVPGTIEALAQRRRRGRVLMDFGWLSARQFWMGYKVSEGMVRNGVFGVPASAKDFLAGEFALLTADDVRIGKLVVQGGSGWGLGPFYTRRGGEPGDSLVIRFDLGLRQAVAYLSDDSLLDEYRVAASNTQPSASPGVVTVLDPT